MSLRGISSDNSQNEATRKIIEGGNLVLKAGNAKGKERSDLLSKAKEIFKKYENQYIDDPKFQLDRSLLGHNIALFEKSEQSTGRFEKFLFSFQVLSRDPNVQDAIAAMELGHKSVDKENLQDVRKHLEELKPIDQSTLPKVVKTRVEATIARLEAAVAYLEAKNKFEGKDEKSESIKKLDEKIKKLEGKIARDKNFLPFQQEQFRILSKEVSTDLKNVKVLAGKAYMDRRLEIQQLQYKLEQAGRNVDELEAEISEDSEKLKKLQAQKAELEKP